MGRTRKAPPKTRKAQTMAVDSSAEGGKNFCPMMSEKYPAFLFVWRRVHEIICVCASMRR